MSGLLYFGDTERKYSRDEYESISACGAPPGVYVPNMSREDVKRWRAKHVGGKNERIEIRKQIRGVNVVLIVYASGGLKLSANGTVEMDASQAREYLAVIREAADILEVVER